MNNSEGLRAQVKALLAQKDLIVRISPGDPGDRYPQMGCGKVVYCPDPKGGKIILPTLLKNSDCISYLDGMGDGNVSNVERFMIGRDHIVRVIWSRDKNCLCVHLPTDPAALPYILWWDYEEEGLLEAALTRSN